MNKLKSGIDSRNKRFSEGENPEGYIPGRGAITVIICNSDDATKKYTYEIHRGLQTYSIAIKV